MGHRRCPRTVLVRPIQNTWKGVGSEKSGAKRELESESQKRGSKKGEVESQRQKSAREWSKKGELESCQRQNIQKSEYSELESQRQS